MDIANGFIIFGASYLIGVSIVVPLIYLALSGRTRRVRLILLAAIGLPLSYVLGLLAGYLYYNPRPFVAEHFTPLVPHAANNGFPSDHMLFAAAAAMVVLYVNRPLGLCLWAVALLIGLSRVLAGVHHPIDILAGAALAALGVALADWGVRRWISTP